MSVRLRQCLAAFALILMLFALFAGGAQPEAAGLIPAPWDKLAHFVVFAVLAALIHGGLGVPRLQSVILVLLVGVADEFHQMSLPGRFPGLDDLFADLAGALCGVWMTRWLPGLRPR